MKRPRTILYIPRTPDDDEAYESACIQLLRAGYIIADAPCIADGIVTLPTMPARTVRDWLSLKHQTVST